MDRILADAVGVPPLCKGRWQKSLIFDGGIVNFSIRLYDNPPVSLRLTASLAGKRPPFVCFADISPAKRGNHLYTRGPRHLSVANITRYLLFFRQSLGEIAAVG